MLMAADPTGAYFGVWQPGGHNGAQLFAEDGAMVWAGRPGSGRVLHLATRSRRVSRVSPPASKGEVIVAGGTGDGDQDRIGEA